MSRPHVRSVHWSGGTLRILDQRLLPHRERFLACRRAVQVVEAIRSMAVRGAPLIGVAAAYGMALAAREARARAEFERLAGRLREARPTAVNLAWAVDRVLAATGGRPDSATALREARAIHREDEALCERMGEVGARLIRRGAGVMTICNTGALATAGIGTAFAAFVKARGKRPTIYALETRPRLQGARLTMWELRKAGLRGALVCDSAAASLMREGRIDVAITGADRIAANGDTANKIGTYMLAVLARAHGVPFYVAAPYSTFDWGARTGADIPIERRDPDEVLGPLGLSGRGIRALNPAFDVTPARLIRGFVTDRGLARPPFAGLRPRRYPG
jgi:methylthioribose-1-phosphate isomerase